MFLLPNDPLERTQSGCEWCLLSQLAASCNEAQDSACTVIRRHCSAELRQGQGWVSAKVRQSPRTGRFNGPNSWPRVGFMPQCVKAKLLRLLFSNFFVGVIRRFACLLLPLQPNGRLVWPVRGWRLVTSKFRRHLPPCPTRLSGTPLSGHLLWVRRWLVGSHSASQPGNAHASLSVVGKFALSLSTPNVILIWLFLCLWADSGWKVAALKKKKIRIRWISLRSKYEGQWPQVDDGCPVPLTAAVTVDDPDSSVERYPSVAAEW